MHDVAVLGIAAENVRNNLAEGLRIKTFVYVLYGVVYIFFRRRYATLHISLIAHVRFRFYYLMIVASRSGPTEMILIGTPRKFSMNAM